MKSLAKKQLFCIEADETQASWNLTNYNGFFRGKTVPCSRGNKRMNRLALPRKVIISTKYNLHSIVSLIKCFYGALPLVILSI